jgi:hypothetical protein
LDSGKGVSGLTSSIVVANASTLGLLLEVDIDHHRKVRPTFGLGLEMEETNDIGEITERKPAEKDEERLCR